MRIVFMGTPDFAVPCLERVIKDGHEVVAVYSQPDKPKGRGYKLMPTPVKEVAISNDLPIYQPIKLKDGTVANQLKELSPDVIVVVAYGRLLPKAILDVPKYGCINVHGSLLPKHRGAAPIQHSILSGDKVTGVTTMYLVEAMDEGDVLLSLDTPIGENENTEELFDRLSILGAEALSRTLTAIDKGETNPQKQDEKLATYAPPITKNMANIDFSKTVDEVHNQVRGMYPYSHTFLDGKVLKVHHSRIEDRETASERYGELIDDKRMLVSCKTGTLELLEVQLEGAKRLSAGDFLRGKRLPKETTFSNARAVE